MFPNLYIAGNKLYHRAQSVPDVSLPGQEKHFSGAAQFNPFTQIIGVAHNNDFGDSWGSGFAMHGVNFQDHDVRRNYKQLASLPKLDTDGMYQPFGVSFLVGAEVDYIKFESYATALDIPLPGLNEMFDFEAEVLTKYDFEFEKEGEHGGQGEYGENSEHANTETGEHHSTTELNSGSERHPTTFEGHPSEGYSSGTEVTGEGTEAERTHETAEHGVEVKEVVDVYHSRVSMPIPSSDERLPFKQHYFDSFNDFQFNYGQVLPHINFANIDHRDITDQLIQNQANPTLIG